MDEHRVGEWVRARWDAAWALVAAGFIGIIVGGVVAAMTAPLHWAHGSWAAAYLVLVAGVAQLGLGIGQAWLAPEVPSRRRRAGELVTWNVGSLLVIIGTVVTQPIVVDLGAVLLIIGLVLFITGVRGAAATVTPAGVWVLRAYVLIAVIIAVSMPVGLVLAAVHAG